MSRSLDELSPANLRDRRIDLALAEGSTSPRAYQSVVIDVGYAPAAPAGVVPPLVFEAHGPSAGSYERREYTTPPTQIVWTPQEGGPHQLTLREAAHNYWYGALRFTVAGLPLDPPDAL